jgi:hypothetical protein
LHELEDSIVKPTTLNWIVGALLAATAAKGN